MKLCEFFTVTKTVKNEILVKRDVPDVIKKFCYLKVRVCELCFTQLSEQIAPYPVKM